MAEGSTLSAQLPHGATRAHATYTAINKERAATATPAALILCSSLMAVWWSIHLFIWALSLACVAIFITSGDFGARWRPAFRAPRRQVDRCDGEQCIDISGLVMPRLGAEVCSIDRTYVHIQAPSAIFYPHNWTYSPSALVSLQAQRSGTGCVSR